jgi:hypothetical protein
VPFGSSAVVEGAQKGDRTTSKKRNLMSDEIQKQLEELACKRSTPFCYYDYIKCPSGRCTKCNSDDLMKITLDDGPEYGTSWIYEAILAAELAAVNVEEAFEDSVHECYPESVNVGWMTLDAVSIMKEMDPVSWNCACSEWEAQEAGDGTILSFDGGSTYYWRTDVENLLEREA